MKYIFPIIFITLLQVSCNSPKKQPKDNALIEQDNTVNTGVIENLQEEKQNTVPEPDIIEIFKLDSINIILEEHVNTSHYLPDDTTFLSLKNRTVFEYNYPIISSPSPSFNIQRVNIPDNSETPFYKSEGGIGGGYTDVSFYYIDDKIIMHLDHGQFDMTDYSEDETLEENKYRRPDEKLIFDAIFVKE